MPARIIDGVALAAAVRGEVAAQVAVHLAAGGARPRLAVVLASDERADRVYAEHKERACDEVGMTSLVAALPATARQEDLLRLIAELNADPAVSGILVQTPLPAHVDVAETVSAVDPRKDIDGLAPENLGLLLQGRPRYAPATAAAVIEVLRREGIATDGARAVIAGRSMLIARPLAMLLVQKSEGANATVTIADVDRTSGASAMREADIVVAAVERPESVTGEMVRRGAVVVDAGLHPAGSGRGRSSSRLVGDVDTASVARVASVLVPAPGGIGPVTIGMLLANTLRAAKAEQPLP